MSPVSILVLLDVSLKAGRPVANRGTCRVSILVLLDVSLKVMFILWGRGKNGFQSLFFWMSV